MKTPEDSAKFMTYRYRGRDKALARAQEYVIDAGVDKREIAVAYWQQVVEILSKPE